MDSQILLIKIATSISLAHVSKLIVGLHDHDHHGPVF